MRKTLTFHELLENVWKFSNWKVAKAASAQVARSSHVCCARHCWLCSLNWLMFFFTTLPPKGMDADAEILKFSNQTRFLFWLFGNSCQFSIFDQKSQCTEYWCGVSLVKWIFSHSALSHAPTRPCPMIDIIYLSLRKTNQMQANLFCFWNC